MLWRSDFWTLRSSHFVARRFYPLVEITLFESVTGLLGCTAIVSRALF